MALLHSFFCISIYPPSFLYFFPTPPSYSFSGLIIMAKYISPDAIKMQKKLSNTVKFGQKYCEGLFKKGKNKTREFHLWKAST